MCRENEIHDDRCDVPELSVDALNSLSRVLCDLEHVWTGLVEELLSMEEHCLMAECCESLGNTIGRTADNLLPEVPIEDRLNFEPSSLVHDELLVYREVGRLLPIILGKLGNFICTDEGRGKSDDVAPLINTAAKCWRWLRSRERELATLCPKVAEQVNATATIASQ